MVYFVQKGKTTPSVQAKLVLFALKELRLQIFDLQQRFESASRA